jgi:hypothetical protein
MKLIPLRYAGTCVVCGAKLEAKSLAWYDPVTKVTCTECRPADNGDQVPDPLADEPVIQVLTESVLPPPAPASIPATISTPVERTHQQKGAQLEQRVAELMVANGYSTRTNVFLDGRSGMRHEIDVLGEKTDGLTTSRVAVECKAWEQRIEKEVVFKFAGVLEDLGIREGIIVALGDYSSGAEIAARERGVILWDSDVLQQRLGQVAVADLKTGGALRGPLREAVGFPRRASPAEVGSLLADAVRGRFGGKEEVLWSQDAWLPVAYLQIALSRMEGVLKKTMQASRSWNTYELVTGEIIRRWESQVATELVDLDSQSVASKLKVHVPARTIDTAIAKYNSVRSESARQQHGARVQGLGIPLGHKVVVESSTSVAYPVHIAIAQRRQSERVIIVDAFERRVHEGLTAALTPQVGWIRESFD